MDQKQTELDENYRLIVALNELLKENFSVSDDTILDKIFAHIEKKASEKGGCFESLIPKLEIWLERVIKLLNEKYIIFEGTKIFAVRLLGLIGSSLHGFNTIEDILPNFEKFISSLVKEIDSCLILHILNDMTLFLNHKEGCDWVIRTGIWKHSIDIFFEDRSIYINRFAVKFISQLLIKVGRSYNSEQGIEILNAVCKPLIEDHLLTIESCRDLELQNNIPLPTRSSWTRSVYYGDNVNNSKHLSRASKYLCDILENLLSNNVNLPTKLSLVYRSCWDDGESVLVCDIINNCTSSQDYQTYLHLLVMLHLSDASWTVKYAQNQDSCPLKPLYKTVDSTIRFITSIGDFKGLMNFCVTCLSTCHRLHYNIGFPSYKEIELALFNQLDMFFRLILQTFDSSFVQLSNKSGKQFTSEDPMSFDDIRQSRTLSLQYFQLGINSIARILNFVTSKASMSDISMTVRKNLMKLANPYHWGEDKIAVTSCIIQLSNLAIKIIEYYSAEDYFGDTIEGYSQIMLSAFFGELSCISISDDPRLTVTLLQVIKKLVQYYPLDILLSNGCGMVWGVGLATHPLFLISEQLMKQMENQSSWEIRDTTLEVYQTTLEVAELDPKLYHHLYTRLQSLYATIYKMAKSDSSSYVRASAFKFFSKCLKIKFWKDSPSPEDLRMLASTTLLKDEMPEPRQSACDLLSTMYVCGFGSDVIDPQKYYDVVFDASMRDLDWEVKKATLRFWQCTITKHIIDEGIPIDPIILTYSQSTTKDSIVLKIVQIMERLSEIGCLKVLWLVVNDDSDITVSQEGSRIIDGILDLEKQWNFISYILNRFDMDTDEVDSSYRKIRTKEFFTNISQTDWKESVDSRTKWVESSCDDLSSLLDHILNPDNHLGDLEHNAIDCY